MKYKEEIIKKIQKMAGSRSVYEIFDDWVKMIALSISNKINPIPNNYNERERIFQATSEKYSENEKEYLAELTGMLVMAMEERFYDILGYIYMHLEISSSRLGQFFTPYHICQMMAGITMEIKDRYELYEPSCGAGGNVIAAAEWLNQNGIDYQKKMMVTCQDLDWRAVYMCYVQLSLYGIPAKVIQGNSLNKEVYTGITETTFLTPMFIMNPFQLCHLH